MKLQASVARLAKIEFLLFLVNIMVAVPTNADARNEDTIFLPKDLSDSIYFLSFSEFWSSCSIRILDSAANLNTSYALILAYRSSSPLSLESCASIVLKK